MTSEAQAKAAPKAAPQTSHHAQIQGRRHPVTGHYWAMSSDDLLAWRDHAQALLAELKPETFQEKLLATAIAEDTWRLNRARAIENNILALAHDTHPGAVNPNSPQVHSACTHALAWLRDAKSLAILSLYETRLHRTLEKNRRELANLQAARKAARAQALEEALLLAQLAKMKREPYDPQKDGYPFTAQELNQILDRKARLTEAKFHQSRNWERRKAA